MEERGFYDGSGNLRVLTSIRSGHRLGKSDRATIDIVSAI